MVDPTFIKKEVIDQNTVLANKSFLTGIVPVNNSIHLLKGHYKKVLPKMGAKIIYISQKCQIFQFILHFG